MGRAVRQEHDDLWRAVNALDDRVTRIEKGLEDEQMAKAVHAGVNQAMRGKLVVPLGIVPKFLVALAALVAIAGGIKGLIGG